MSLSELHRGNRLRIALVIMASCLFACLEFALISNVFTQGYYLDKANYENYEYSADKDTASGSSIRYVPMSERVSLEITPPSKMMRGFAFAFDKDGFSGSGSMHLELVDSSGSLVYMEDFSIEDAIKNDKSDWHRVYLPYALEEGERYTLSMSTFGTDAPVALLVDSKAAANEVSTSGDIVLAYAYEGATFTGSQKVLLTALMLAAWLSIVAIVLCGNAKRKHLLFASLFIALAVVLTWNYMFCSFDTANGAFANFQADSESLVTGAMTIVSQGRGPELQGFGLGRLPDDGVFVYRSQFGLQGMVFSAISQFVGVYGLYLITAGLAAVVFCAIVFLIRRKYNLTLAVIFYLTFLLSPWIVNFARNLYWVEFTWFVPLLTGLVFSLWGFRVYVRNICCVAMFLAILIKCLCGYEYISTIMLAAVAPVIADLAFSIFQKDRKRAVSCLKGLLLLGVACLLGFIMAITMHAGLRGGGNYLLGLQQIFEQDVLRRTSGGDINYYPDDGGVGVMSITASHWETVTKYFAFSTQVVTGIPGNLFPVLVLLSLASVIYGIYKQQCDPMEVSLYAVFFLAALSWFMLAKGHSYVHTHMNYVLWYFGYIQMCFYVLVKSVSRYLRVGGLSEGESCAPEGRLFPNAKRDVDNE